MRRMSLRHVVSLAVLVTGFSCSTAVVTAPEERAGDDHHAPSPAYPSPSTSDAPKDPSPPDVDAWRCGYEIIVVEGPQGELIESQIPLACDPHADVYQGCPAPLETSEM